jgi:hypothetical protein
MLAVVVVVAAAVVVGPVGYKDSPDLVGGGNIVIPVGVRLM